MNFQEIDLSNLIPKVYAESADALVQPTFGTLDIGDNTTTRAAITLRANGTTNTAVTVGQEFEVEIRIETGNFSISEYRIVIDYDISKLSVIDAEPSTTGTQIQFQDTVFTVDSGDNTVTAAGLISLRAHTPAGNAVQVNRTIGKIRFQSQATGTTVIELVEGIDGTQLINENGIAIATTPNNLTLTASPGSATSISSTSSTGSTNGGSTSGGNTSGNGTGGNGLPATGLGDDLLSASPLLIGLMLVALGNNLRKARKRT